MRNRIKGCLWKEGANGLGVRLPLAGTLPLPYRRLFDVAAREHDRRYDLGGGGGDRRFADLLFLWDCAAVCRTDTQAAMAMLYYTMVRLFGWLFFNYNDND